VALISDLRRQGYSGTTIAATLTPLSRVFGHAARRGLIDFNPVSKLDRRERPRVSRQERPVLNPTEIGRLLEATRPRYRTSSPPPSAAASVKGNSWAFTGETSTSTTNSSMYAPPQPKATRRATENAARGTRRDPHAVARGRARASPTGDTIRPAQRLRVSPREPAHRSTHRRSASGR
jgi:hypothetical protein